MKLKVHILFLSSFCILLLNKYPASPFSKNSLGPFGQSLDITNKLDKIRGQDVREIVPEYIEMFDAH